jgi:hypothetical protein
VSDGQVMFGSVGDALAATRYASVSDAASALRPEVRARVGELARTCAALGEEAIRILSEEAARLSMTDRERVAVTVVLTYFWMLSVATPEERKAVNSALDTLLRPEPPRRRFFDFFRRGR